MIYKFEEIEKIHLEITDKCNAACPQCSRNICGGSVNPSLPLTELTLEDIKKIFSINFVKQLKALYACGNYGDPAFAKETLEIYEYLRSNNSDMVLAIVTNGGIKPAEWWKNLANIIGKNGYVIFSIDGLEDTNHIYRRNVKWSVLMRNVKAFIEAGGEARWEYIVFGHNEHQIEEARQLAKNMNFKRFDLKKTGRFFYNGEFIKTFPIKNKKGEIVDKLHVPSEKWQNEALLTDLNNIKEEFGSLTNYYDQTCINCKVKKEKSLYISADGLAFPCCWLAHAATYTRSSFQKQQMSTLINKHGKLEDLDALKNNLKDIVEGEIFKNVYSSWYLNSIEKGKIETCARICGESFQQYVKQKS